MKTRLQAACMSLAQVLLCACSNLCACGGDETDAPPASPEVEPLQPEGWAPQGARTVGLYNYDVIPRPDGFHTMHGGPNNSDHVWVAVAPELELDWVAETGFYVPEGPTYDNAGNLYFSPLFPREDVSLVSLNATTGQRNWAVTGDGLNAGSGAVLVLNDPDAEGTQLIYHATFTEVMALRPDGTEIWREPTGLELPVLEPGQRSPTHCFGFNYHPRTDALVGVTLSADIFAFNRKTGQRVAANSKVPGSPAASVDSGIPPIIVSLSDALTDEVFGTLPGELSFFSAMIDVLFGGGSVVTNYFAIDPTSSVIYVAATADDGLDGVEDGVSEVGAIYSLDLVDDGDGGLKFDVLHRATFAGGTGSTPSLTEDGERVFASDNLGHVIAYDRELNELWRFDVGSPIAASIAVSPDNGELFAVTSSDVFKLVDRGDRATLEWTAKLNAFVDDPNIEVEFQALTPTITANGIAVSVGGGKSVMGREVMLKVGVGLLDRETGVLKSFTLGREESIAVTSVAADGSIYTANSPVRRVSGKALFEDATEDIIGGISRYKPVNLHLLVRDAVCAAGARAHNAATLSGDDAPAVEEELRHLDVLISQANDALFRAQVVEGFSAERAGPLEESLAAASENLMAEGMATVASRLLGACASFESQAGAPYQAKPRPR